MRVLIIEDEEDLVTALAQGLKREGYAVDVALDGLTGLELASINEYDLLVLDLNLPGLDGLEICRQLRSTQAQLLILILTARDLPAHRITGLDNGADDYLTKPFHFGELLARLRALLRRDMRGREPLLHYRDLKLDPSARIVWQGHAQLELTNKEFGILEYLLRRPSEVVTQQDLLEHIWDINANPFSTTVRVHVNSLRRKLQQQDTSDSENYIQTVVGKGYRLGRPDFDF